VGGLSVVGPTAVFVDTAGDAAYRVLLGAGLDGGTRLGTDLPADALLGDRAVEDRLPVVLPGENVLRLVDVGGLEQLRPGGPPIDVPLGAGGFSAPVVGESAIALLDVASGRLLTFGPDGARLGETQLPPGSTADDLTRGEDGRLYLDEPGGGRTHVVQPDGSVTTVDIGDGTGPAVAAAPPPEQLAPVRPPLPGQVVVPTDAPVLPVPPPNGGPAVVPQPVPGGPAAPDPQQPLPGVDPPPDADPVPPPPDDAEPPPPAAVAPEPPTGLTAQRENYSGSLLIDLAWTAPAAGLVPVVGYQVSTYGPVHSGEADVQGTEYSDNDNYCAHEVRYEVRSVSATGVSSVPATVDADDPNVDCTPRSKVLSAVAEADGSVTVQVECFTFPRSPFGFSDLELLVDGEIDAAEECRVGGSGYRDLHIFSVTGLAPASTHTVQSRTERISGVKTSDPVTVTTVG
jgi:hypothetical protein